MAKVGEIGEVVSCSCMQVGKQWAAVPDCFLTVGVFRSYLLNLSAFRARRHKLNRLYIGQF